MYKSILTIVILFSFFACSQSDTLELVDSPKAEVVSMNGKSLQEIVREKNLAGNDLSILIDKSEYTFQVLHKDSVLITYPCVFGFNPVDDKHQEGDGCTPEGTFKIRSKYPHRSWSYFIWIDYPNKTSWKRFNDRKANGEIDDKATIGGEIGIHGVPKGADEMISSKTNWTLGCISLTTKSITDVYKSIGPNTIIEIVP
ncbi:MAG: L,D-transpeptidase [Crocinitomicaceae bacterium]|nr:L,D-transpeptidase [Crocinitomicaceae bacterium]